MYVEEGRDDLSKGFFPIWENFLYQIFVIILRDIIVLEKFILSFSQS